MSKRAVCARNEAVGGELDTGSEWFPFFFLFLLSVLVFYDASLQNKRTLLSAQNKYLKKFGNAALSPGDSILDMKLSTKLKLKRDKLN